MRIYSRINRNAGLLTGEYSAQDVQELSKNDAIDPGSPELENSARSPEDNRPDYEKVQVIEPANTIDSDATDDGTEQEHFLPPNLETRRKKKAGSMATTRNQSDGKSTSLLDSRFVRKCGAKRKFLAEDEDSLFEPHRDEDYDGFEFSRPVQLPGLSARTESSPVKEKTQSQEVIGHVLPGRKVLEPSESLAIYLSDLEDDG